MLILPAFMEKLLSEVQLAELRKMIDDARRVVCVCHVNPDGDALGSTLALWHWMRSMGKECSVVVPNCFPDFLAWMPGASEIIRYDKRKEDAERLMGGADLMWVCDLNCSKRVLEMENALLGSPACKVMVDHHQDPDDFCNMVISEPQMCATCEILCHVLYQMGVLQEAGLDMAVCLYTGMMTDTGAFTYNSSRPVIFDCICRLLERGVDKDRIYRNVMWTATPARMRLIGYMLYVKMEVQKGLHTSLMTLTNAERRMLGVKNGDTEGVVNLPLQISGMRLSALLSEDTEHRNVVRISLRSVDDFPCNEMSARFFNGGGHMNAAGGRLECSMDEAVKRFHEAVKSYEALLK